ncbi:hypothetical protein OS493_039761, partial [Desmophyllum pertusum]
KERGVKRKIAEATQAFEELGEEPSDDQLDDEPEHKIIDPPSPLHDPFPDTDKGCQSSVTTSDAECQTSLTMEDMEKEACFRRTSINVGIVHIVNGELKIKRSSLMPITVPKSSSSVIVRRAAIDKHKAHNVKLPDTLDWKLLYPDFQEVNNIPGSKHFFTVQKYHESLGKSYQRINLYLCRIEDLEDT